MQSSEPIKFSVNPFIKLYAVDMAKQMSDVYKRLQQGSSGYDYYRNLNLAIKAYILGKTEDEIEYILNSSSNPNETMHNKLGYQGFIDKFGKKRKKLSVFEKKSSVRLDSGGVLVSCSPTFSLETSTGLETYHVWAAQTPPVSSHMGALACYLSREAFRKTQYSNHDFRLFDAVGGRSYSKIFNTTAKIADTIAKQIVDWAGS